MLFYETKKELEKRMEGLTYKDIKNGSLTVFIYNNGKAGVVKYDIYGSITLKTEDQHEGYDEKDYIHINIQNKRIGGYGYDRWSTALSEGLNTIKNLYKIKTTLNYKKVNKVTGFGEFYDKKGSRVYGLYKDGSISYGIGVSAVLDCVKRGFSNVKLDEVSSYQGRNEDRFTFTIKGRD